MGKLNGRKLRLGKASCVATLLALAGPATAAATTTIGQVAPDATPTSCSGGTDDVVQGAVSSGASYIVPPGAAKITSWSTNATTPDAGQTMTMKVFRIVSGTTYQVVGHDGPHTLTGGALNTFPANVPVQPGDVLGLNRGPGQSTCVFLVPGDTWYLGAGSDLADGQSGTFTTQTNFRVNASAVVAFPAPNDFTFGKVTRNKKKGTATLRVKVPGSGKVSLTGEGVKVVHVGGGAVTSRVVAAAGTVNMKVRSKGSAKFKLNHTGKASVKALVTFTPDGASIGEAPGPPNTEPRRLKLVKRDKPGGAY